MADVGSIARAGLSIGGALLFGPVGAIVGGLLGDLLFPPEGVKGPRLDELNVQRSTVGAPIPIVYGTARLAGNVIWSGGLIESESEQEAGGKGGGPSVTNYSYSVDVAVGICEGPIDGVRRIWADADLIYDASDDATLEARLEGVDPSSIAAFIANIRAMSAQLNFDLYLGDETQLADPTIESYEVAGSVPAFRGLAYIVFPEFQLEKFGNRIPNFRFEVYTGAATECGIYSAGELQPWVEGGRDPRDHDYLATYQYRFGGGTWRDTFAEGVADMEAGSGKELFTSDVYLHAWQKSGGASDQSPCDPITTDDQVVLFLDYNVVETSERLCGGLTGPGTNSCDKAFNTYGVGVPFWQPGSQNGLYVVVDNGDFEESYFNGYSGSGSVSCGDSDHYVTDIGDVSLQVRRTIQPPSSCDLLGAVPLANAPGWCSVNGQVVQGVTWTEVAGTFKVLQPYDDNSSVVQTYPVNPAVISTDPSYNDQAFWEAAYADALAAGEPIAGGLVYGVDYPVVVSSAYFAECDTVDAECVPMATIVADICARAGLRTDTATQIDVSGLTTCVSGYVIGRQMSARDALGPLRQYGLWDAVESGDVLRFVERGAAIVESLTTDDLGAHEYGSEAPPLVEVSRIQEKDLPRRLRLHFANFEHDHDPSEQSASRITTEATNELDVELPISMTPDTAAQLSEIMLYESWIGRNAYKFSLDNAYLALEPTDCVEIPVDGQTERVRITEVDYSIGGILQITAIRDDDGSYVSTVVATPAVPSGGIPGAGGNGPICPSGMVLLDLPRLREADVDCGFYAAVYGLCDSWNGAEIYRSSDSGATYGRIARTDVEATVGEILSIGDSPPPEAAEFPFDSPIPYDTSNTITVQLFSGTLQSITDEQILAGQNSAAIGIDGRWVIVQYKTATLDTGDTWILSDLLWGLNETEDNVGTTVDGDTFVLLNDSALVRLPETFSNLNVTKLLKAVSFGEAVDDVEAQEFATGCLSYRPNLISEEPPDDGEIPIFNPDTGEYEPGCLRLEQLCNVAFNSPENIGDVVTYIGDDSSGPLFALAPGGSGDTSDTSETSIALRELSDVDFTGSEAQGDILYRDASAWQRLAASTIGFVLRTNGAGANPSWGNPSAVAGGALRFIGEVNLGGSPATSIQFSGLDLDSDGIYFFQLTTHNVLVGNLVLSLTFNADTTATNYDTEALGMSGASTGSTGANNAAIANLGAGIPLSIFGFIANNIDAKPYSILFASAVETATRILRYVTTQWRTASTNVTAFTLTGDSANGLDGNTVIRVWAINT